ncbi:MAG: FecR domain-containing protein [Alphaproteobacteria bacterium]|nr:FecR domain-containing protein [Alphaproteobacteria bacterium]
MTLTRRHALLATAAVAALAGTARATLAADGIGAVESLENEAWGTQVGATRVALAEAAAIFRNQRVETGDESATVIRFVDTSKLTLGENASAVVDEYVYAGDASRSTTTLAKGAFRFISGQMPEKNMKLKTPTVTIGIRGTELKIDVYEDGSTELSTIEGAANIVSNITNDALDILAGQSVLADSNGVLGVIRDFIHKSKDELIERGKSEIRDRLQIPDIPGIPNPFR